MQFGMPNEINTLVTQHCLQWLGHEERIKDNRLPKQLVFGELCIFCRQGDLT